MMVTNGHSDESVSCQESIGRASLSVADQIAKLPFQVKQTVLCFHGPLMYEARILRVEMRSIGASGGLSSILEPFYLIHYKGWKPKWDEWVQQDRLRSFSKELLRQQNTPKNIENNLSDEKEDLIKGNKSEKLSNSKLSSKQTKNQIEELETGSLTRKKRRRRNTSAETVIALEEDTQHEQNPLLKINLPNELWELLQDDFVEISQNKKIYDLPVEPSVSTILNEYLKMNPDSSEVVEFVEGIERCFNKALGLMLLYRFERQQYSDLYHEQSLNGSASLTSDILVPSKHYGFVHLLRLLTKITDILPIAKYSPEKICSVSKIFDDFVFFLNRNYSTFFSRRQYVSAPPQYRALAKLV